MVAALGDNHAGWFYPSKLPPVFHRPGAAYGLGITTSPGADLAQGAPAEALPPLFVTAARDCGQVLPGLREQSTRACHRLLFIVGVRPAVRLSVASSAP
jgi:hypothetical protein